MKRITHILIVLLLALCSVGCESFHTLSKGRKSIQGSPYEVLVVCNGKEWESALGTELRQLLETPVEAINQSEPMYNVVRITANDFKGILPSFRNILQVLCTPSVKECAIMARYDVEAAPQIVLTFQGPTIEAMVEYLQKNGENLIQVLEIAERDRSLAFAKKHGDKAIEDIIASTFNIDMRIPKGYSFRAKSDNFLWISYEYPVASQGFFLYSHPYKGKQSITTEALVAARNSFAQRIPGPSDNSFMTTVERVPNIEDNGYVPFEPQRQVKRINGRDWIELRGLWDVEGDFMGGPFVSYTTLDERSGQLITLDCYVYSPKYGKRNFLRALEHLVYGITFPTTPSADK